MCPRTVVPEEGPATVVVGAFAHGAVSFVQLNFLLEVPSLALEMSFYW